MARHYLFVLTVALLAFALPSEAAIYTIDPVPGYDCAGSMNTGGCFSSPTATAFSGPTVTRCSATRQNNQRCRKCVPKYLDNGQDAGYKVCAFVPEDGACSCTFPSTGCKPEAYCDYYL